MLISGRFDGARAESWYYRTDKVEHKNMGGFSASLGEIAEVLAVAPQALVEIDALAVRKAVTGVTTDTRTVRVGELFVALEGETFDGHNFAAQAVEKGAIAAIVRKGVFPRTESFPRIEVADTLAAYQALGQWWRSHCATPVIAITGSVGKTTTKEIVAAALSQFGAVLKTQANYNNEIGCQKRC